MNRNFLWLFIYVVLIQHESFKNTINFETFYTPLVRKVILKLL